MADGDVIVDIGADASAAIAQIDRLSKALKGLKTDTKGGFSGLQSAAKSLNAVKTAAGGATGGVAQLNQLSAALKGLKEASSGVRTKSVANGLKAISDTVKGIDAAGLSNLNSVVGSLNRLNGVKISKASFNGLEKLPSILRSFEGMDMTSMTAQLNQLSAALLPFASRVKVLAAAWKELPAQFRTVASASRSVTAANRQLSSSATGASSAMRSQSTSAKKLASGMNSAADATAQLRSLVNTGLLIQGIHAVANALAECVNGVNQYVESMNLAQTVMGSDVFTKMAGNLNGIEYTSDYNINTGEGNGFWTQAQTLMGVDSAEAIKYQAVFEDIITGMGVARSSAEQMSQQLTQLGYDISSFNNISIEQAMQKIQSGVSGELEPMRRIGYDLSVARQQQDALTMGIEESVINMTQAEKVQLRYYEMMTQITEAHGDLARTLTSPANQIRILQAQVNILARNVGALLLPVLNAVVPVLTAIVKLAQNAVISVAALFGVDLSKYFADLSTVDYSSMMSDTDDVADATDDAADATERAADAAEEWKKQLMGFDEINNLSPASESSSASTSTPSTSTGSGVSDAVDIPSLGYNFFDGLADNLAEQLEGIISKLKAIIPIAAGVAAAFGTWKLAGFLTDASKALQALKNVTSAAKMPGAATAIGGVSAAFLVVAATVAVIVTHFTNLAMNSENFRRGCVAIGSAIADAFNGLPNLLDGIGQALNQLAQGFSDGLYVLLKGLAEILGIDAGAFDDFVESAKQAFGGLGDAFGYVINDVFDLQWSDALMVAAAAILAFVGGPVGIACAIAIAAFEGISLAIRAVGWATSPCIEQVDALGGVSEETASRFGTSLDSMTTAFGELEKCSLPNAVVSDEDVATVEERIADVHDTIVNNLDSKRNEELANIDLIADMLPEDQVQAMKDRVNDMYDSQITSANDAQARLSEIYTTAANEHRGLTETEAAEVKSIQENMQEQLIQSSGATEEEMSTIRENMKNNNTQAALEAASSVIQSAIEQRDQEVQAAWDTYNNKMQAAESAKEAGLITQEQYDSIKQAALDTAQSQQDAANEAYYGENGVLAKTKEGLGENAKYIDEKNGEIKSNWDVAWGDISSGMSQWWEDEKSNISEGLENIKTQTSEKTSEMWEGVKTGLSDIGQSWSDKWNEMKTTLSNKWTEMKTTASDGLSNMKSTWDDKWQTMSSGLSNTWTSLKSTASNGFSSMKSTAAEKLAGIVTSSADMRTDVENAFNSAKDGAQNAWSGISSWFWNSAFSGIGSNADNLSRDIGSAFQSAKNSATSVWNNISSWFSNNVADPISDAFWSIVDGVRRTLNRLISFMNSLRIDVPEPLQEVTGWSSIGWSIPYLASGGFVESGQLFVARESGPEMVGQMGGKTAVANNEQIVAGIASGVASANASQNQLLMEQNSLLRELIAKAGGGSTISATDISTAIGEASRISGRAPSFA